ncbi:MAG: DUF4384 domain-containing protein [Tannerella sp.]|jgi:hypothetical protein|nr:DUF4384 domain-containing protein [Tannerella sp.]
MPYLGRTLAGFIVCVHLLCGAGLYAQTVTVRATGSWDMAKTTIEKVKLLALENAKENALRKAGVPEEFIVVNTAAVTDRVSSFVSHSNSELLGEIVGYDLLHEQVRQEGTVFFYTVEIEAKVKTGRVRRDLEFDVLIEGIQTSAYRNGDLFSFSLKPYKDCYVHVFWLDETGSGAPVYPNQAEAPERLQPGTVYSFPRTQSYKVRKEVKDEPVEIISLIFVFTRKNIPYTSACSLDNIQKWVMTVPSYERLVKYNSIVVTE